MKTEDEISKIAAEVARVISIPKEYLLWDSDQASKYLGVSRGHFRDRIASLANFPEPAMIPSSSDKSRTQRWFAIDIMEWVKGRRSA